MLHMFGEDIFGEADLSRTEFCTVLVFCLCNFHAVQNEVEVSSRDCHESCSRFVIHWLGLAFLPFDI